MPDNLKLYYSIKEVSEIIGVNESTLRFWEKEFPRLKPRKGSRGIRKYQAEDIELLKQIYFLVKEQGLTLPGARERLKEEKRERTEKNFYLIERLKAVREKLADMRDALDKIDPSTSVH